MFIYIYIYIKWGFLNNTADAKFKAVKSVFKEYFRYSQ